MGTSIQFGEGDGIFRLHIHIPVEKFYEPEDYIRSFGTITKVAKENLVAQMEENQQSPCADGKFDLLTPNPGDIAVVTVAPGIGFSRIFASMGAAAIIEGGQTMNPSTEEIFNSFESLPTDNVIILPNNKNIILAASNAAELTVKNVAVIPSRTVPQGLCAMMRLIPDGNFDEIVSEMNDALLEVETGEITTATRSVEIDGVNAEKGEIISLLNGKIVCASKKLETACLDLLKHAHADHFELITLYYGEMMPAAEVYRIEDVIRAKYPDLEIEIHPGCQPHYHFIISIE
jgi:dihydroxyacetone kinase-like predicted kinase